ncbi:uncharacterized protein [Eurosta solidaginis]|uniref:uncharacterized protein n=1 Tax=Eurosta solidaginis TaxID=178769 RepID=UPI003530C09A
MEGISYNAVFILCVIAIIQLSHAQISYPERFQVDKEKSNLVGRIPLYSPSLCKQNELLYPGDHGDDWTCDCAPASLYYPDTDACYIAFRQGPCENEQLLVLAPNRTVPQCIINTCKIDGQVKINNICYEIGHVAPCHNGHLSYVLGVNPKTLMLDCIKLSAAIKTRIGAIGDASGHADVGSDDDAPSYDLNKVDLCARGTKRAINGTCTPTNVK